MIFALADDLSEASAAEATNVVGSRVTIHDPFLFRCKSLLDRYPEIPRCCGQGWLPEDLLQLYCREPGDLAQAHSESRFA